MNFMKKYDLSTTRNSLKFHRDIDPKHWMWEYIRINNKYVSTPEFLDMAYDTISFLSSNKWWQKDWFIFDNYHTKIKIVLENFKSMWYCDIIDHDRNIKRKEITFAWRKIYI